MFFVFIFYFLCQYRKKKRHVFFIELLICVIVALETGDGGGGLREEVRVCESVCVCFQYLSKSMIFGTLLNINNSVSFFL